MCFFIFSVSKCKFAKESDTIMELIMITVKVFLKQSHSGKNNFNFLQTHTNILKQSWSFRLFLADWLYFY